MSWEPDEDESTQEWSDPTNQGGFSLEEDKEEETERKQADLCAEIAKMVSEEEFLLVQMLSSGENHSDIAAKLGQPIEEMEKRVGIIHATVAEWWEEFSPEDLPNLLEDISTYGQQYPCERTGCPNCLQRIEAFCWYCGTRNSAFQLKNYWLVMGITLSQARKGQCKNNHPDQIAYRFPFCELCGEPLRTIPQEEP